MEQRARAIFGMDGGSNNEKKSDSGKTNGGPGNGSDKPDQKSTKPKGGKYFEAEIKRIKGDGFKNNPLRQAYESKVACLKAYGEKLDLTYDWLVSEKGAANMDIVNLSSRPNSNIDKLLSGFEEWLRRQ